ncbi:hypothetical protein FA95DRAFT_1570714 [Auriscalpium vulgare]|uniref:Uncharacterized protein n=1 Tax=Auriscalpium vulgare TaxID=40419 RepID=A0ACB8S175_9AGAM|nr:hypothetical protein FA95DRAFT_1570714 [Auriscalpium vulgare]
MSSHAPYSDPSDDDVLAPEATSRRRSSRACDQCRRTKSKCQRYGSDEDPCHGCLETGSSCTYVGPSHKRGPPKGYIHAIERRLHQVEALMGTIIGSSDPRAQGLFQDLSRDPLACQIIHRVEHGPFGPKGRVSHPFGSTKEDFLAAIMSSSANSPPGSPISVNKSRLKPTKEQGNGPVKGIKLCRWTSVAKLAALLNARRPCPAATVRAKRSAHDIAGEIEHGRRTRPIPDRLANPSPHTAQFRPLAQECHLETLDLGYHGHSLGVAPQDTFTDMQWEVERMAELDHPFGDTLPAFSWN